MDDNECSSLSTELSFFSPFVCTMLLLVSFNFQPHITGRIVCCIIIYLYSRINRPLPTFLPSYCSLLALQIRKFVYSAALFCLSNLYLCLSAQARYFLSLILIFLNFFFMAFHSAARMFVKGRPTLFCLFLECNVCIFCRRPLLRWWGEAISIISMSPTHTHTCTHLWLFVSYHHTWFKTCAQAYSHNETFVNRTYVCVCISWRIHLRIATTITYTFTTFTVSFCFC